MPEQAEKKWCPLARVSIQQKEVGRINAIPTGAFNFVIQQMPDGGEMTFIPVTFKLEWSRHRALQIVREKAALE